jgi:RNA polymerase sigma-70 factor, ECF subfamily
MRPPVHSEEENMAALENLAPRAPIPPDVRSHWEALYVKHYQVVWRTLRRMGYSPDAAAEATQQAFLISVQRASDVLPVRERAFLFSTAIRVAKTTTRKHRRLELTQDLERPDLGRTAVALEQRQYALAILDRVLLHMDDDLITVFCLFELEEFSSPEIATWLDIPLGTVASRLRRARERFREITARLDTNLRLPIAPAPVTSTLRDDK